MKKQKKKQKKTKKNKKKHGINVSNVLAVMLETYLV